jgi:hypothetical protein
VVAAHDTYRGRARPQRVRDHIGHDALEQPRVGHRERQVVGHIQLDRAGRREVEQRRRDHLVERHRPRATLNAPDCSRLKREQVLDQGRHPVGRLVHGGQQFRPLGRGERQFRVAQARHPGLDAGQRRAQVVPDGGQQRGPQRSTSASSRAWAASAASRCACAARAAAVASCRRKRGSGANRSGPSTTSRRSPSAGTDSVGVGPGSRPATATT